MRTGLRGALLAGAAMASAIGGAGAVWAQGAEEEDDTVTVTGSRIRASGFTTPTPVTAVSSEELELAAPGNIVTALVQLPQFYNSSTTSDPSGFFVSPGAGNLNLRGLATDRTLVLLNGRRVVSSTRYGGTDINTFPEGMIRTVEAVTGGASAAYGTDAVAGVVNFVLDTDFTGLRAHSQYGVTDRGDNENWEAGVSFGADIGGRAHLLLSGEIYEQEGVYTYADREWYREWGIVSGAAGQPARLVRPNVRSSVATLDGMIIAPGTSINRLEFLPDGSARPFVLGPEGTTAGAYASHTVVGGASGTDNNVNPAVQPKTRRESYFAYLDVELTDDLTVYGQGIWGENSTRTSNLGGFFVTPFAQITIYQGNPYLPADIAAAMAAENIQSFTFHRVGSAEDTARERIDITQNTMWSLTGGFDWELLGEGGDWLNNWQGHGYYQHGRTSYNAIQRGGVRIDRLQLATDAVLDANGNVVCRVNTEPFLTANGGRWSDCEPLNLFGRGNASEAALDWVIGFDPGQQVDTVLEYTDSGASLGFTDSYVSGPDKVSSGEIRQDVFEVAFDGELWEGWGAGPISAAFGFHYREESINQVVRIPVNPPNSADARPVPANNAALGVRGMVAGNVNNSVAIQFSKVPNIRGSLNTTEFFGELLVPLIANRSWMRQLNASLQARRADYSGSGEIWAWKVGGDAQLTDDLRLRATRSRDVRAATLSERFDRTGGFATVNNWDPPCTDAGVVVSCSIFTVSGGNPGVQPEKADTLTLGAVYQPGWLDGLSVSIDWYDIKLKDAIATLTAQQIVDECIAGDQTLCARIELNAAGQPSLVNQSVLNVNAARVTGVDVEAAYRRPVDWFGGGESINLRLYAGYQSENSRTNFGAAKVENAGNYLFPELKVTGSISYSRGPLTVFLQERYTAETNRENFWVEGVDIDDNSVDAVWYTDLNVSYDIERMGGDWQLFANVANLLDEDPPVVANFANFGANSQQTLGQFDRLGRRYTVGLRARF